ncbi:hypothetical protein [Streptomyces sp. NPDC059168]|uniref:hypothetical protein n=1 Tax=Streptomyces sp. NPDC059168 TaxID=3346753 RepID=UPI0036AF4405
MDAWLDQDPPRFVPQESPAVEWIKEMNLNPQLKALFASGASMKVKYKETARGGLAVNIIEC